jgi:hypothetical protein
MRATTGLPGWQQLLNEQLTKFSMRFSAISAIPMELRPWYKPTFMAPMSTSFAMCMYRNATATTPTTTLTHRTALNKIRIPSFPRTAVQHPTGTRTTRLNPPPTTIAMLADTLSNVKKESMRWSTYPPKKMLVSPHAANSDVPRITSPRLKRNGVDPAPWPMVCLWSYNNTYSDASKGATDGGGVRFRRAGQLQRCYSYSIVAQYTTIRNSIIPFYKLILVIISTDGAH